MCIKLAALAIFLLTTYGCSSVTSRYYSDDKKRAEKAIERFHDAYNRQSYDEIFDDSHPEARATKSREKLHQVLSQLFDGAGRVRSATLIKADVTTVSATERKIELRYRAVFEKGVRTEFFTCFSDDSVARMHTFAIATAEQLQQANIK